MLVSRMALQYDAIWNELTMVTPPRKAAPFALSSASMALKTFLTRSRSPSSKYLSKMGSTVEAGVVAT